MNRIPVLKIILSAAISPILYWRQVLWFAVPLIVANGLYLLALESGSSDRLPPATRILAFVGAVAATGVAWSLLAVAYHRILLLGEESMAGQTPLWWTWRESRFFGWVVVIGVVGGCVGVLTALLIMPFSQLIYSFDPSAAPGVAWLSYLVLLPATYVATRISLVLPATATDHRPTFQWAWHASHGNGLRLLIVVSACPFLFQLIWFSIWETESFLARFAYSLTGIYVAAYQIGALTMSYWNLASDHPVPDTADAVNGSQPLP